MYRRLLNNATRLAIVVMLLEPLFSQEREVVKQFTCTEMLFGGGWFKDLRESFEKMVIGGEPTPVLVIHKRSISSVENSRVLLVIPIVEFGQELGMTEIKGYTVRVASISPVFSVKSMKVEKGDMNTISDLWMKASFLAVSASYMTGDPTAIKGLVDADEYRVFSTFRPTLDHYTLSGHMMFMLNDPKDKSRGAALRDNIEAVLERVWAGGKGG